MPCITISYVKENLGADAEQRKSALADKVSKAVSEEIGVSATDVWVVFDEVTANNWYVGPRSVKAIRAAKT